MFGFHAAIRLATLPAFVSPLAPSPAAESTNGWPEGGVVPLDGLKLFPFTGGWLTPLLKDSVISACCEIKPSRISASTARVWLPSTKRSVRSSNVYGDS